MRQHLCKILEHNEICAGYYYLKLAWQYADKECRPGQFVEVKVSDVSDPLLRRPFSIFDADNQSFSIAYRVIGKGTKLLREKKAGEFLDIIGFLGNGFFLADEILQKKNIVFVGGGTGTASLHYCAKLLKERGYKFSAFCGFKSFRDMFCMKEWNDLSDSVIVATEDGSVETEGYVTDIVPYSKFKDKETVMFICGPLPMMKSFTEKILEYGINSYIQASLEAYMACGMGVCNGCVVKIKEDDKCEYKSVCKQGPVFSLDNIVWD